MKVPRKMIFNHFFHFWPCQVPLWAVGAEKQPAERPPTEKPKVFQKYLRTWGEGRNDHIELGPSVCQWIQNINLIRLPEGPNWSKNIFLTLVVVNQHQQQRKCWIAVVTI